MVVGRAGLRPFMNMRKNAKLQLRVLEKKFAWVVIVGAEMGGDEITVDAGLSDVFSDGLQAIGPRIVLQGGAAIGRELFKCVAHGTRSSGCC